ncbi:hypothetical protein CCR85_03515 [Rhodothalassium salexigens]|uniref:phage tail protein n=1 Tax=Rhodothalassium salexigens TaxID=1086 RepID=UPI001914D537|nr:phage tail protein [Rhodothalassium salexigens]MBK5910559.1 hypothetical protein [Rhodothalassium salexigens]MBK5920235.1 hypothetical protein [Rhodothalassium salexigens]
MASLVLLAVAQAAVSTAAFAAARALAPSQSLVREGPRLEDLSVQSSALGGPIPLIYGRWRAAGNVIWSTGLIERREETTEEVGGKGGRSQSVTNVTYVYSASFAVALAGRAIADVGRIWADGRLIREAGGALDVPGRWRLHRGTEDQAPDALIQAHEGLDATPAFRGLAYAVFEDLALGDFGNRIPNLTFEVIAESEAPTLTEIAGDLGARVGVPLDGGDAGMPTVPGLFVPGDRPARDGLAGLFDLAPVLVATRGGGLRLRLPSTEADLGLSRDLLDARPAGDAPDGVLQRTRADLARRPREVAVRYADPARDYQPGVQRAGRRPGAGGRRETLDLPMTLAANQAKALAGRRLQRIWSNDDRVRLVGPMALAALEPGDRLQLTDHPEAVPGQDIIVDRLTIGPGLVALDGRGGGTASTALAPPPADTGRFPDQTVAPVGETHWAVLDLPLLPGQIDTPGRFDLFAALTGPATGWRGGRVFLSTDQGDSYISAGATGIAAALGDTLTPLAAGPADLWDECHTLTVRLIRPGQSLISRSALAVLNGANLALVGDEVIQFRTALPVGDDAVRLDGLLRGRLGSPVPAAGHPAGSRFVLLSPTDFVRLGVPSGQRGRPVLVKAVSVGGSAEAVDPITITPEARALRPLSPAHLTGRRNAAGDLSLRWIRRTRVAGDWLDGTDVPLGEEREAYAVDILGPDGTVVRTLHVSAPDAIYTAAQQGADFGTPPPTVTVRVAQISAAVGRGRSRSATL